MKNCSPGKNSHVGGGSNMKRKERQNGAVVD